MFDAEGNLQTGGSIASTAAGGIGTVLEVGSGNDPVVYAPGSPTSVTINPLFKPRGPFSKIQVGFLSTSTAMTCKATLVMQ